MATSDLAQLIAAGSEELDVEYKAWMDTTNTEVKAKLAKHLAALANHGGGYLIFGVDDATKQPLGACPFDPSSYGEDAISAIVNRYLDPPFQCRSTWEKHDGRDYPIIEVPPHTSRPVVAKADGPTGPDKKPIGVRQGALYIRVPGPGSEAIVKPDDWTNLIERCLRHRTDLLASIMRQAMGGAAKPSARARRLLEAATNATAQDFATQLAQFAELATDSNDQARIKRSISRFVVLGYGLTTNDGEPIAFDTLRGLVQRASHGMRRYAYRGDTAFLPSLLPDKAPQLHTSQLLDEETHYLEDTRLEKLEVVWRQQDYWRIYEAGIGCWATTYREDATSHTTPRLEVEQTLIALHTILAHARLVGQETPTVAQILVRMDWRGLQGRQLYNDDGIICDTALANDIYTKTIALPWAEVRDDYPAALRRLGMTFFDLFPLQGHLHPDHWLTADQIAAVFAKFGANFKLFSA